ncbi:MAG: TolC family protein [Burkholderiaceae bacterium]|jgi:outer membrane protein TolC|nr:TolC family protein [Burkholderiaceae bacterium]
MLRIIVMAAGWLLAAASQAQTLGDALEKAWSRHPQAQVFDAREAEAKARTELAAGLTPAPPSMSLSNVSDRLNAATGKEAWELEVALPMWLPGQRAARGREADSAQADVAARRTALRLQLAAEVREAWWALAGARNALDLATHRAAAAKTLQADVQRRLKAGELARIETNLADLEQLAAESEALEAQAALQQAEQVYRTLTGADAPALLAEEAAPITPAAALHPQLIAAQAMAQLAQARMGVATHTGRDAPELALRWVRDRGDTNAAYADSVGIKLTVPLGSAARLRENSSAALAESLQADAELALTQQRLEQDIARAQRDAQTAQLQLTKAQERLALTEDTLRLTEKSFALGESDLPSLLRARAAAFEALAHLNRQRTARAASLSRVNQSMGVLP